MAEIKIVVATPAHGEMFYAPYVQSVLRLQRAMHQRGWSMRHATVGYAYVAEARNFLLTHWFDKTDATHLLFVDADMGFEPRLVLDMVAFDKPVIGVIYTKRQVDLKRLVALAAKGETEDRAVARAHDFILRPLRGRAPRRIKGYVEVEGCGTGIMLIRRDAIATMLKMLPDINDTKAKTTSPLAAGLDRLIRAFDNVEVDGVPLMDDFAFCHRWQALCKGELWARADQSVTHIGLHKFAARYTDAGAGTGGQRVVTQTISLDKLITGKAAGAGDAGKSDTAATGARKTVTGRLALPQKVKPGGK
jgi:hypothetical protein